MSHGTHVAGIIFGKTYGTFQPPKSVQVYDVRVVGDILDERKPAHIKAGLDTIIARMKKRKRKAIINICVSMANNADVNSKITEIMNLGGIVVVAAGNRGIDAALRSPPSAPDAITVGNIDKNKNRWQGPTNPSNWGSNVDIWAPGVDIVSSVGGRSERPQPSELVRYECKVFISGQNSQTSDV